MDIPNPLSQPKEVIPTEIKSAITWMTKFDVESRRAFRWAAARRIVALGKSLRDDGSIERWLSGCDDITKGVLEGFNGPLLIALLDEVGIRSDDVPEMMRCGAPLIGVIPTSGTGVDKELPVMSSTDELLDQRISGNASMIEQLRSSEFDEKIFEQTVEDADLKRMSYPKPYNEVSDHCVASKRFAIQQGERIRCVDDMTASRVNPCAGAATKIREHRL